MSRLQVCVVGGGLAGLRAAITCADAGADVTLLESRGRLGGATFSIERDGLTVDNGQHLVLRCCASYLEFLDRLGTRHQIAFQRRLHVPVLTPGGPSTAIGRTAGPPPLHLAAALARNRHLSAREKVGAADAMRAMARLDLADPSLDETSFGSWLREQRQSPAAVGALWGLVSVPTVNMRPDETSLAMAAMVFRTGLLERADAADIGVPSIALTELHATPAAAALRRSGATVRTSCRVAGIRRVDGRLLVDTREDSTAADAVIVAVPHDVAGGLLPPGSAAGQERFASLGHSPIVSLHVAYDRRVCEHELLAGYRSPVQWVFDRTHASGVRRGQCLAVTLSAADEWIGQPVAALRARFLPALADLLPAARTATVQTFLVVREPHATFRAAPGSAAVRPAEVTNTPGVFLAGSWTDTGWPATMEGAVRSGLRAARRALAVQARGAAAPGTGNGGPTETGPVKEDVAL